MLLLPVVSAATALGVVGTLVFTMLAAGGRIFVPLFAPGASYTPDDHRWPALVFLAMVGNLVNTLAEDLRVQSAKYAPHGRAARRSQRHIREAEDAVRRSDRLAALGQLSAGLAHELRNPLGTIRRRRKCCRARSARKTKWRAKWPASSASEVDRTNSLITRFLQFARPLQLRLEPADLAHTLDRAVAMVEREAPGHRHLQELRARDSAVPLRRRADGAGLLQPGAQRRPGHRARRSGHGEDAAPATATAEIAVIDRGVGIDRQQLDTIFNPFFTTKPAGRGAGPGHRFQDRR